MERLIGKKIYNFDKINSTNVKARELAINEPEGTVITANEQSSGKGRLGRSWLSLKDKGIYMSIILKPQVHLEDVSKITLIGAAAVNQALSKIGIVSRIKWPNDIVIDGKKVCGILTEMHYNKGKVDYVIMGIGINVNLDIEDIPDDLLHKVISLKIKTGNYIEREKLISIILEEFESLYIEFINKIHIKSTISICKTYSAILGKEIQIINGNNIRIGKAIDINENGELVVEFDTGIENIISGEISIRGINGYI